MCLFIIQKKKKKKTKFYKVRKIKEKKIKIVNVKASYNIDDALTRKERDSMPEIEVIYCYLSNLAKGAEYY